MKYIEGQKFNFKILSHLEYSENEKYYILEDCSGRKQLLNSEFYSKYNFNIGQDIICRVDHINCSGKIFLEPEHPIYKEGELHDFTIDQVEYKQNRMENRVIQLTVKDKLGEDAVCRIENDLLNNFKKGQDVSCKVERIKKGKLYLSLNNSKFYPAFIKGNYYKFKIVDLNVLSDNFEYYILTDESGFTHLLKSEYYHHHHLHIGDSIECTIIKFSSKGFYVIEPRHPYYEIDKDYTFEFVNQTKEYEEDLTDNYKISVKDNFDEEVKFISEKHLLIEGRKPDKIKCKVTGIKKGKPLLSFLSHV